MPISGAIFDFDGTLVDSMPAWHDVTVRMLERYGVPNAEEFFVETESLPLRELCEVLHDRHVPSVSTDDLEAEIKADMREAYLSDIDLLDGCLDFLDDLRAHGVPMVVASSTPASELEVILRAKNIRGYFQDVFSTGGEIRSKDYPDIWHVARERLGTPASETWVFEDAPFSLRSATGAGFRTACLFSPHGDRTPQEVAPFSTFKTPRRDFLRAVAASPLLATTGFASDADGRVCGGFGHQGVFLLRCQFLHANGVQFIFFKNGVDAGNACLPVIWRLVAARADVEGADADAVGFFRNVFVKNDFLDDGRRWRLRFRFSGFRFRRFRGFRWFCGFLRFWRLLGEQREGEECEKDGQFAHNVSCGFI